MYDDDDVDDDTNISEVTYDDASSSAAQHSAVSVTPSNAAETSAPAPVVDDNPFADYDPIPITPEVNN